jgi:molecular chaperone GrpE (heat shock protein)
VGTDEPDDPFAITERPLPVPPGAATVDLAAAFAGSVVRYGRLEGRLAEAGRAADAATRRLLLDLLPVADALDTLIGAAAGPQAQRASLVATRKLLGRVLTGQGVQRVEVVGTVADPQVVDIEDTEPDPDLAEETVVRELVPAYLWHGVVLRRGVVVVSSRTG